MIPARYAPLLSGILLSALMSLVVSGLSTWKLAGAAPGWPALWMASWLTSWLVACPTVLVMAPVVRRLVIRLTAAR